MSKSEMATARDIRLALGPRDHDCQRKGHRWVMDRKNGGVKCIYCGFGHRVTQEAPHD